MNGSGGHVADRHGDDNDNNSNPNDSNNINTHNTHNATTTNSCRSSKRLGFARVVPEEGKKRVNYNRGHARQVMEEAVSLCEAMALGYEVVFHGRRRSYVAQRSTMVGEGVRGLSADPVESSRREDADANLPDSKVAYIARSKRDVAEYFGVAWSTMQPRLVGKIGTKPAPSTRAAALPDTVEAELYQHVVWLCENGYPATWDSIKAVAWQLGKIAGMQDFTASNQWLKRFKGRFPGIENRYSHHLRTCQLFKAEANHTKGWSDERSGLEICATWGNGRVAGAGAGAAGSSNRLPGGSVLPSDPQATTAGGYLALQRAKVEAEAGTGVRRHQQQAGVLPSESTGEAAGMGAGGGAGAGVAPASAAAHQEAQLRLPHASMLGGPSPHLLGHGYTAPGAQQLAMGQGPPHSQQYPHHGLLDSALRSGAWGPAGAGMLMGAPSTREELQQQQLGLAPSQAGPMGIGGQRLIGVGGQEQQQQQQQQLMGGGGTTGTRSGLTDASGMHHLGIAPHQQQQHLQKQQQAVQSQGVGSMHFAGTQQFAGTGQSMVMGLGGGVHPQQVSVSGAGGGMMMYSPGGVAGAGRAVPPNQTGGTQAMRLTTGQWQQTVGWPEQMMRPWQHLSVSQVEGLPPQQLQPVPSPSNGYQGYPPPPGLDESQYNGFVLQQQLQQQQLLLIQQQQQQQQQRQAAAVAGLNSPMGLEMMGQQQPVGFGAGALGVAGGRVGGAGEGVAGANGNPTAAAPFSVSMAAPRREEGGEGRNLESSMGGGGGGGAADGMNVLSMES
ncbi:unnamed protein product [Pylaiella littoralis]